MPDLQPRKATQGSHALALNLSLNLSLAAMTAALAAREPTTATA